MCLHTQELGEHRPLAPKKFMSSPYKKDKSKCCDFHKDHSHRTNECIALKFEIVEVFRKGYLVDILTNKGNRTWNEGESSTTKPSHHPMRPTKPITVFWVVRKSAVRHKASAKRHRKALLSLIYIPRTSVDLESSTLNFSSEEVSILPHLHHDALVIYILISKCLDKRTLIDNGSSTNVIFLSSLKGMQVPKT